MVGFIHIFSFRKSCGTCPARLQLPAERERVFQDWGKLLLIFQFFIITLQGKGLKG